MIPLELESAPSPACRLAACRRPKEPKGSGDSAALAEPARAGPAAALPSLEPAPGPAVARGIAFTAAASRSRRRRPQRPARDRHSLAKTETSTSIPAKANDAADARRRVELEQPGRPVARVGEEIITYHDVIVPVREHRAFRELKTAYRTGSASDRREAARAIRDAL